MYSSRIEGDLRLAALMLLGAVGVVLLIACVNLATCLSRRPSDAAAKWRCDWRLGQGAHRSRGNSFSRVSC